MKGLKTYDDDSYMPLWQEDLKFVQEIITEVLTELSKSLAVGSNSCIIGGCETSESSTHYTISRGMALLDGEVFICPEQSIEKSSGFTPVLRKKEATNPEGDKLFLLTEGGTETRQTYDVNYLELYLWDFSANPTFEYISFDSPLQALSLLKNAIIQDTGWLDMTLINGWTYQDDKPQYRVIDRQVFLRGDIDGADSTDRVFASLPPAYCPSHDITMFAASQERKILIRDNGEIECDEHDVTLVDGLNWLIG